MFLLLMKDTSDPTSNRKLPTFFLLITRKFGNYWFNRKEVTILYVFKVKKSRFCKRIRFRIRNSERYYIGITLNVAGWGGWTGEKDASYRQSGDSKYTFWIRYFNRISMHVNLWNQGFLYFPFWPMLLRNKMYREEKRKEERK